jgi:hypothetical protein
MEGAKPFRSQDVKELSVVNRTRIVLVATAVFVLGCGLVLVARAQPDQPPIPNVAGTYDCNPIFGQMHLLQRGRYVIGAYEWDRGCIQGLMNGNVMTGEWMESPTYKGQRDAGCCRLTFTADGSSFTGTWGYGSEYTGGKYGWNGSRSSATVSTEHKAAALDQLADWMASRIK